MRTSLIARFLATPVVQAKKGKAENIIVKCKSLASGYPVHKIRPRLDDKLEFMSWDPMVQDTVLYREVKKVR